jgi:hypothetical protein
VKKSEDYDPEPAVAEAELLDDNDAIEVATHQAKGELGDLKAAIAHVDRMLAISAVGRDSPDARVEAILDWIENEMLDADYAWRDRRLILFTEWEDTRRWLVERVKEGLLQGSIGRVELDGRIPADPIRRGIRGGNPVQLRLGSKKRKTRRNGGVL